MILIFNFNMCTTFTFLSKLKLTNGYYLLILSLKNPAGFYLLALKSKKASGGASPTKEGSPVRAVGLSPAHRPLAFSGACGGERYLVYRLIV